MNLLNTSSFCSDVVHDEIAKEARDDFQKMVAARKAQLVEPHMTSVDLCAQVEYHFTPAERRTFNHPGSDESAELVSVKLPGLTAAGNTVSVTVELPREVARWIAREVLHG